ncbi:PAS domain S-box protein [Ktedonobacteria bacterium brp13]|nr:PAS domain S-box protein [Ktedonobacteria bacterium brp13]
MYANVSAQAMTGTTREELHGNSFWRCAPQLVSTSLYQAVCKTKQTRALTEVEYLSPVTQTWLHVQLSPTVGGLMLQFHEGRAPTRRQESFPQSEYLCADILENISDRLAILTPDGMILSINQRPLEDAQVRREEVIGKPLAETPWWSRSPASQGQLRATIARVSRGETVRFEAVIQPMKGVYRDLDAVITPHIGADNHIEYLVYAGIDITARKRAEAEIRALIDAIPHLVWTARPDGYLTYHNQRLIEYWRMTHEQAEGVGWLAGVHPDERPRVWEAWQTSIRTGEPYEVEHRMRDGTSGADRWFLARGVPQRNAQGTILHWVGTCTDIEEQKQAEQKLKESEENWRVLAETVPQLVWVAQPDGLIEYQNQRWRDYIGFSSEYALAHEWSQSLHPDEYQHTLTVWHHALETGEPYEIEYRLKEGQTGAYRWFLARGMPVRDEAGQIVKWFGTCTDIDEQKRAEQRIKASEENLRVLAETVPQLVWVAQPDGQHEYTNQHWCDYTGFTLEQLQSDRWPQLPFIHPDDRVGIRARWQQALDTGAMYEHEGRLRNGQTGEYRWFLTRGTPMRDETGQIIKWFGTCTDIDEQKRIEEALRQSQERIRALINSNIIGIISVEVEGEVIVEANDAWLHMTGYSREDVRNRTLRRGKITPPKQAHLFESSIQEIATRGQHTPIETEVVCQDGSRLPVLLGGVTFREHPRQIISFMLDNSACKELEQRKDDFISMASHELKTPLTALQLQTQLLAKRLAKQGISNAAPALSIMEMQGKQLERLIEELLDVSKIQAGRLEYVQETVDLDALLREITDTMQQTNPSHTLVVRGVVQTSLMADRDRLGQVFTNLISNAIKYSPEAQTVEIDLSVSPETVTVSVRDHGLGIPRELRDKVFERFYRATDPQKRSIPGLGMGLYIVAEIVKRHGGTITVDSEVGRGSTFTVTLPLARNALA